MMIEYIGLVEKVKNGYTLFFPDFPGFGSDGNTFENIRKNAREGLLTHIELMLEEGETIPRPSSLDVIMTLPEAKDCIPLFISILTPAGKAQRINITLDSGLLEAIDIAASNLHKSRSTLLAEAAQRLLSEL